jgi:threonylcarbamoyladenosine tRNA methylthiotransferase MtaB
MIKPKDTISFYTLGCRLNQSETAVVQKSFEERGFSIVDFDAAADVVVINTCTVTENGDADTRRLVRKAHRLNPNVKIALIGCQAQVQKEKLTEMQNIRWVVGNAKKMDLASIITETETDAPVQIITPAISRESFSIPLASIDKKLTRANIKIQDGCDFFCSFCEIPYARGRARSRVFSDILREVKVLTEAGYKEIVITGINVGTYQYKNYSFLDVISALEDTNGVERIRISSIEPTTIPSGLIDKMARDSKVCRYLHIPLQSASDPVLSAMKRKYTVARFKEFITTAAEKVKHICIGTDVIVGFPAETEEQFMETQNHLREWPIHYFHVFSYSKRTMAKSREFKKVVPARTISQRSELLRDLSYRKRKIYFESLLGSKQKVLFEQKKGEYWNGLTDHYARVHVQSHENLLNRIHEVHLKTLDGLTIIGEII